MDACKSRSFFQDILSRELNGFRVRKRPCMDEMALDITETGVLAVKHSGEETPPLAISFCKTSKNCHILAVSDEEGYVSLFDTRRKVSLFASHRENSEKARISEWVAHQNSIFDLCWIKEDTNVLTASGDQTIKLWDTHEKKCTGVLMGHTGSIKSLCSHPTNSDLLASGSRDGSFAIWDLRCKTTTGSLNAETYTTSTAMVQRAHLSPQAKRVRRSKTASMSVTSVLYLKDEVSIATAGAVDSIVKFWDTRNLKAHVTQACPRPKSPTEKERRLHGISSLSQDLSGVFLTASCMDSRVYLYNILQLDRGPIQSFTGCHIESFFVKSAISPDAAHIVSGSSDGNAYLWQVNKPAMDPITLKGHDGEVTAVDWCTPEVGKMASSSDDFTVCIWNIQSKYCPSTKSPASFRRRVMAPTEENRELLVNEERSNRTKDSDNFRSSNTTFHQIQSPIPITMPNISTPEAQKNKVPSGCDLTECFDRTPEAARESPSSVLNPPTSTKRKTIRDYFLAA